MSSFTTVPKTGTVIPAVFQATVQPPEMIPISLRRP